LANSSPVALLLLKTVSYDVSAAKELLVGRSNRNAEVKRRAKRDFVLTVNMLGPQ
jgi:hypothetical protein